MKIVMDFRKYDGIIGGVERGVIQITRHVAQKDHSVVILSKASRQEEVQKEFEGFPNLKFIPLQVLTHGMSLRNVYLDSVTIQNIAREEAADVIHFPYNWSFPFRKNVPSVLTIHDVIPLSFREAMDYFTNRFIYHPGIRTATRLNNLIATVSKFSKDDMCRRLGVSADKVRVIPNGLRAPYEPSETLNTELEVRFGLNDGFILYIGGIHERKNVVGLIHAFAKLVTSSGFTGKLLVTGNVSGAPYQIKMKQIHDAAIDETGMQGRVVFTGFIPDEELDTLLKRAFFLVYTSFYEGFGMPVLEAMRVGTPVITSTVTALPEVAGDAALLVDPYKVDDIAQAMSRLLQDEVLRQDLSKKGIQRAQSYSWERTADMYVDLYKEICG
jgi:glycosyltransferase involved in cell wall biosynthesis